MKVKTRIKPGEGFLVFFKEGLPDLLKTFYSSAP
jgi:hypothetical protein